MLQTNIFKKFSTPPITGGVFYFPLIWYLCIMETKTLTEMMLEYRLFTDKIQEMYAETKMRNLMGGDKGIHIPNTIYKD